MKTAKNENLNAIINYLKTDIPNCIYMYIDISVYGLRNPNMKVWFDGDENGLNLVIMKYYDSIQLFSHSSSWDIGGTLKILLEHKPAMIAGRAEMIERIYARCDDIYKVIYGSVIKLVSCKELKGYETVETAKAEDIPEIAGLICTDAALGSHYTVELLTEEMAERIKTNMGRSYIIKKDGLIIAHSATYAEAKDIAVTSGLIVREGYRDGLYGAVLNGYMINKLHSEKKEIYAFYLEEHLIKLFKAMHNEECARYGKLTKKGI